ncbi:hypothetical protein SETIT_9G531600v2 [Setaria italica]|uniref:Uncharacterized protein n=1 Tax=Setaria italica TaxID=4555 RepID=A0A368SVL3_SETIT|nr:hypothetical protein SETIT_9G531600v2 [Setaria italica]
MAGKFLYGRYAVEAPRLERDSGQGQHVRRNASDTRTFLFCVELKRSNLKSRRGVTGELLHKEPCTWDEFFSRCRR